MIGEIMPDFLSKLTSYDLFNYLFSGIIFVIMAKEVTNYSFVQSDIFIGSFLYYFIGLVVSRFGSLVIEPLLKGLSFIQFADYKDFIAASKKDEKIALLSEVNNTYRTLISLFILLLLLKLHEWIEGRFPALKEWDAIILVVLLLILFLFSYRKQTDCITERINSQR